jgi:hypothetical protein
MVALDKGDIMEYRYIDHSHPYCAAIIEAQKILAHACGQLRPDLRRKATARRGYDILSHAVDHLAEHVRNTPEYWRTGAAA